jgi:peptide-methionine (S)-S-oxide reductase
MSELAHATFGGGCFWCIEAVFDDLEGVERTVSGYAGGDTDEPTYEAVCAGTTGHAEVVQVIYDPDLLDYEDLLSVFFAIHDPTTKNREGPDVGSQYRSIVLYHSQDQREAVEEYVADLDAEGVYDDIVTEIEPLEHFWEAEAKHQNFFERNPNHPYCTAQIPPKLEKVTEKFPELASHV